MLPFLLRELFDVAEMEGFGHAHLNTYWIAVTQVAFDRLENVIIQAHVSKGACVHAQAATKTQVFGYDNGACGGIACQSINGADLHAAGGFTLQTGAGEDLPSVHVHIDVYAGMIAVAFGCLLHLAGLLATQTGNAPIEFYVHNFHAFYLSH